MKGHYMDGNKHFTPVAEQTPGRGSGIAAISIGALGCLIGLFDGDDVGNSSFALGTIAFALAGISMWRRRCALGWLAYWAAVGSLAVSCYLLIDSMQK